jgi:hypothetical protein
MSLEGIKLAISDTGGEAGKRRFPLMNSDDSWKYLRERCIALVSEDHSVASALVGSLSEAISESDQLSERSRLAGILGEVCSAARQSWDLGTAFSPEDLGAYCRASLLVHPLPPLPRIENCWKQTIAKLDRELELDNTPLLFEPAPLSDILDLIETIRRNEPRWLIQVKFPESLSSHFAEVLKRVREEMNTSLYDETDEDELQREVEDMRNMADQIERIVRLTGKHQEEARKLALELRNVANTASRDLPKEPDDDDYRYEREGDGPFDIEALFSDL